MGSLSHTDIILKEVYCHSTEKFSVCYRASNMNKHLLGGNHDFYRYSDASYAPCHPGIFTRSTRHHLLGEAVLFNGMPRSSLSSHCDSGFGNFNNARLLAYKLWQRGASGICLEDKGFPKMNSFIGDRHPLADTC